VKGEKESSVVRIKVVVQRKGGDENTEMGSVHEEKQGIHVTS